jgi:hypothetical protein
MKTAEERLEYLIDSHFQNVKDDMEWRDVFKYGFECGYTQPKWISVEEPPEEYEWVIGCNDEHKSSFQTRLEEDGRWIKERNPTHWMPLPTPPTT